MNAVYVIWSGWEGPGGDPDLEYFKTKDKAVRYLKSEGFKLKKQGYGPPLWEKYNQYTQCVRWADIYVLPEYKEL